MHKTCLKFFSKRMLASWARLFRILMAIASRHGSSRIAIWPIWLLLICCVSPLCRTVAANAPSAVTTNVMSPSTTNQHLLTFGLDRVKLLQVQVMHNPLWQYLASLIYVLLAFYVAKLLDYVVQFQLRKWAARTATNFDDLLLTLLNGPA